SMIEVIRPAHEKVAQKLGKEDYTREDLKTLENDSSYGREVFLLDQMFEFDDNIPNIIKEIDEGIKYFSNRIDYHLNVNENFRTTLGDNPYNINDTPHGNNQVSGPDPKKEDAKHGTHVAGILAAKRNNGIGMNGVAQN